jgi:hypothetical protein
MSEHHTGILVRIRRWDETAQAYPAEAQLDDGSFFRGELHLDRKDLLLAEHEPEKYGLQLFYALLAGPIRQAYDLAAGQAQAQTGGRLRVRLWIDAGAAELHALPWERLYHVWRGQPVPLAASTQTPFSRYTALPIAEPEPLTAPALCILIAISNPRDLPPGLHPINVESEVENLRRALGNLRQAGRVKVTLVPGRTGLSPELRQRLEDDGYQVHDGVTSLDNVFRLLPGCHVFHFLGHGVFRRQGERGEGVTTLFFEKEDETWEAMKDGELVTGLDALGPLPHLVFLAACETAVRDPDAEHPFVGLGPKLVKAGVPAVVAMQDVVPMDLARQLTGDFYRHLIEDGLVDLALNRARLLLFEAQGTEWAIPVLFTRLKDGQLFAADPVHQALQAILADSSYHPWPEREYLPIEVVHLVGQQDAVSLQRVLREPAPSVDLVEAIFSLFSPTPTPQPSHTPDPRATRAPRRLVALVGDRGTARSTQLKRIAWLTADRSLQPGAVRQVLPIYVNLVDLHRYPAVRSSPADALARLTADSLRQFWPGLTSDRLSELLRQADGPTLRILFDGGDDLPELERRAAWQAVSELARRYSRHQFVLSVDPDYFDPRLVKASDLLVIQPLSRRRIVEFLDGLEVSVGRRLYGALTRAQLFDLAASPWLMARMLDQTRQGRVPESRTAVLRSLVEDAVARVPASRGMRARAARSLYALAWKMQSSRLGTYPISDAFRVLATVRGNREYGLEELYEALVANDLLAGVGAEDLRFAYPAIRAYCCAQAILTMPSREQVLEDITATLARLTRLRWWEDVLVLLSGLIGNPDPLLRQLLYGTAPSGGEQAFLATRCLLESGESPQDTNVVDQLVDALVWRLDSANERLVTRRVGAAQALGELGASRKVSPGAVVPYLARVATQRVRTDWRGNKAFAYSSVRMAAAIALQRIEPFALDEIESIDRGLGDLMVFWDAGDVEALAAELQSGDLAYQAIAAFALGALRTDPAVDHLVAAFLRPDVPTETRWAVTDSLTQLDPVLVTERAVLPLLDERAADHEGLDSRTWRNRAAWYDRLAYLIGKIRAQDPIPRAFLDRCLYEFTNVWVTAKAVQSLGWMYDRKYKKLFEEIALGDFSRIAVTEHLPDENAIYLRRKAIEALASIGDLETLTTLRAGRTDWSPELERAFYWTTEEITWRLGRSSDEPAPAE